LEPNNSEPESHKKKTIANQTCQKKNSEPGGSVATQEELRLCQNFGVLGTLAFSFLFDKYYPIMD